MDINKLVENSEAVKTNFEKDEDLRRMREFVAKKLEDYRKTINYMACDAPLQILGLSSAIETALLRHGCNRVNDLFDMDFTEVKGLGPIRIKELRACLDQFFFML